MKLLVLIVLLISLTVKISYADKDLYTLKTQTRGLNLGANEHNMYIIETQICFYDICFFISPVENQSLNLGVGDTNAEIAKTLANATQLDLAFLYYQLDRNDSIEFQEITE